MRAHAEFCSEPTKKRRKKQEYEHRTVYNRTSAPNKTSSVLLWTWNYDVEKMMTVKKQKHCMRRFSLVNKHPTDVFCLCLWWVFRAQVTPWALTELQLGPCYVTPTCQSNSLAVMVTMLGSLDSSLQRSMWTETKQPAVTGWWVEEEGESDSRDERVQEERWVIQSSRATRRPRGQEAVCWPRVCNPNLLLFISSWALYWTNYEGSNYLDWALYTSWINLWLKYTVT